MDLDQIIAKLKKEGKSIAEIVKYLRDNNYNVTHVEVKIIYNNV